MEDTGKESGRYKFEEYGRYWKSVWKDVISLKGQDNTGSIWKDVISLKSQDDIGKRLEDLVNILELP